MIKGDIWSTCESESTCSTATTSNRSCIQNTTSSCRKAIHLSPLSISDDKEMKSSSLYTNSSQRCRYISEDILPNNDSKRPQVTKLHSCSGCESMAKEILESNNSVKKMLLENNLLLKEILKRVGEGKPREANEIKIYRVRPKPADTIEELEALVNYPNINEALRECCDFSLGKTVSGMLKTLMTRKLAMQFSLSGLGPKRQKTKNAFRNTSACLLIEDSVNCIEAYSSLPKAELMRSIGTALKGASDWEGGRGRRKHEGAESMASPPALLAAQDTHRTATNDNSDNDDYEESPAKKIKVSPEGALSGQEQAVGSCVIISQDPFLIKEEIEEIWMEEAIKEEVVDDQNPLSDEESCNS